MARLPKRFVDEILWPEFQELNKTLATFLSEMTDRVIQQGIEANNSEIEVESRPLPLGSSNAVIDAEPRT